MNVTESMGTTKVKFIEELMPTLYERRFTIRKFYNSESEDKLFFDKSNKNLKVFCFNCFHCLTEGSKQPIYPEYVRNRGITPHILKYRSQLLKYAVNRFHVAFQNNVIKHRTMQALRKQEFSKKVVRFLTERGPVHVNYV